VEGDSGDGVQEETEWVFAIMERWLFLCELGSYHISVDDHGRYYP